MTPAAGDRLLRFLGDRVTFRIAWPGDAQGMQAFLRTNLGRAARLRAETIASLGGQGTFAGASWRDIPMRRIGSNEWELELPLTEIGFFHGKPYLSDSDGVQRWPDGGDIGIGIHPSEYRTANTIYCAFARMFGAGKRAASTRDSLRDGIVQTLDGHGYAVLPPSGTLRDLAAELPHIVDRLGCTILHLLPVGPTPTTYARFGRFGSPYAQLDLTAIDPALVVFDKRTTAVDQFRELTAAAQRRGCRVFLDIVINHTGWGSTLLDSHPEWFQRNADGTFHSPGAWGNTWEDLVELDHSHVELWETIAKALLTWCRRGVNGFRCDAGYMVPLPAWQFIVSRVRLEFPSTVFLLEGLGGSWEATESLLTAGGMQWAYSELFQNYDAASIASYLDHCHRNAAKRGVLVHYAETHDNLRLAAQGRAWSLFRNRLCALASHAGAYGFTAGVEWLADEKLEVHQSRGLRWDAPDHIIEPLAVLNRLLANDPCFFDGATVQREGDPAGGVVALVRSAPADWGNRSLLVLANPDREHSHAVELNPDLWHALGEPVDDLLGQPAPAIARAANGSIRITVEPLTCLALATSVAPMGTGDAYRLRRAQAAWAYACLAHVAAIEDLGPADWRDLATWVAAEPQRFLAAASRLDPQRSRENLLHALAAAAAIPDLPPTVTWTASDATRVVPVPPGHWVLVRDTCPFRVLVTDLGSGSAPLHGESVAVDGWHVAALPPTDDSPRQELELVRGGLEVVRGRLMRLRPTPGFEAAAGNDPHAVALLTNGRGGMARLQVDLGTIRSKYDCLLGANLHPDAPCDRHVLAKRLRAWVNADGFVTPLNRRNLGSFVPGPPATWRFVANAGDGRTVVIDLTADLLPGRNTTVLRFTRADVPPPWGTPLPASAAVRLVLRVDLEDRSFHNETVRSPGSEGHFSHHCSSLAERRGFIFAPSHERCLRVTADRGRYRHEAEWCQDIAHPIEAERGMTAAGDAYSPGWFDVPLTLGESAHLVVDAEVDSPDPKLIAGFADSRRSATETAVQRAGMTADDHFGRQLATAVQAYLVNRGKGRTVIAGYPWFLDWGRDTFIAARGLLAAGMTDDVRHLLLTFGRFEENGTLPNLLNGDRAENRDTSDAPLWYAVVLEEMAVSDAGIYGEAVGTNTAATGRTSRRQGQRTLGDVVRSIACGYLAGTPNGIRVDGASALVWSPAHFTWMDTNHPACTPRAGYPIEIQVLWIRLLRHLDRIKAAPAEHQPPWRALAEQALASLLQHYWMPERGWFADVLLGASDCPAARAVRDDALRPNQLFAVSLGVVKGELARQTVAACLDHLAIPGAIRSLAPLPLSVPLLLRGADGTVLANPELPYQGHYIGDEDTRRKPAYHNGTAWTWPFPNLCEAMAMAWDRSPTALAAARSLLGSMDHLLQDGCLGHIPEILDGDAPHTHRGCDAQAWGVSEALRVWKLLR